MGGTLQSIFVLRIERRGINVIFVSVED